MKNPRSVLWKLNLWDYKNTCGKFLYIKIFLLYLISDPMLCMLLLRMAVKSGTKGLHWKDSTFFLWSNWSHKVGKDLPAMVPSEFSVYILCFLWLWQSYFVVKVEIQVKIRKESLCWKWGGNFFLEWKPFLLFVLIRNNSMNLLRSLNIAFTEITFLIWQLKCLIMNNKVLLF